MTVHSISVWMQPFMMYCSGGLSLTAARHKKPAVTCHLEECGDDNNVLLLQVGCCYRLAAATHAVKNSDAFRIDELYGTTDIRAKRPKH